MSVATIIADSNKKNLTDEVINELAQNCENYEKTEILQQGIAANIYFSGSCTARFTDYDVIIQRRATREKRLLICDMESTIISNEFLDEIADHLGIKEQVEDITIRAMEGELGFEDSMHERIALVKGAKREDLLGLVKERMQYNKGAKELIAKAKENGIYTMLVSGGFTLFTQIVADELGFDEHYANELIFKNDILAGVKEPILGKEAKQDILKAKTIEMGIELAQTAAIGDGANDLPMLKTAGLGIAYRGKDHVKKEVPTQFNVASLDAAIFCFGSK